MTSELIWQEALRAAILTESIFKPGSVVINDWSVLDAPNVGAPFVIIQTADNFDLIYRVQTPEETWELIINLVVRFDNWDQTLMAFRDARQSLVEAIAAAAGQIGLGLRRIASAGPVTPVYDQYVDEENRLDVMPIYLSQAITVICENF